MAERFIRLTDLEGNAVWVGMAWIQKVRAPRAGEWLIGEHEGAGAVVELSGYNFAVRETVDEVMGLLNEVVV